MGYRQIVQVRYGDASQMPRTFLRYGKTSAEMPVIRNTEANCRPPPTSPASELLSQ